jgi:hypothetical protein
MYRATFLFGNLPGDRGDARWTLALHEHWLRVWQGQEAIRDLHYYSPLPNVLGTSEAFLVQGHIHALLRLGGLEIEHAWAATQMLFFLGGALGVAYLSRRLFRTATARTAFVLLTCCSYPITAGFVGVQLVGFLYLAWLAAALIDLIRGDDSRIAAPILLLGPPLLAMSSWYAFVLGAMAAGVLLLSLALFHERSVIARCARNFFGAMRRLVLSPVGIPVLAVAILGYVMVLWIYVPARSILPEPYGGELTLFSPRWSDIFTASGAGGGLWGPLYDKMPATDFSAFERARGFTPILLVSFVVIALSLFRGTVLGRPTSDVGRGRAVARPALLAICVAVVVITASVIIDERGLGIFALAFNHVPGVNSIRCPFRIQPFTYALIFVVILRTLEDHVITAAEARRWVVRAVAVVLLLVVFVEMQRSTDETSNWTTDDSLPATLRAMVPEVREKCDAVMVANEDGGQDWVGTHIDGVVLATLAGVTTPQGYSRATPLGYPFFVQDIVNWSRDLGFDGRMCLVSTKGLEVLP